MNRYKDVNDCLLAGVPPDTIKGCLDNARDFAPAKVRRAGDYEEAFLSSWFDHELESGLPMPFGFPWRVRAGECTVWTGIEKSGKTTMLSFILMSLLAQGERAMVASLEVRPARTLKKYSRQALGDLVFDHKQFSKLNALNPGDGQAYRERCMETGKDTLRWLDKNLWVYDHVGIAQWRDILEDCRWARRRHGITQFVLDNFMRLGMVKDDYAQQAECINSIAALSMELNVHIHVVVHQNKSEGQKGFSGKRSVSGAFEILAACHNVVEVQRDTNKGQAVSELFQKKELGQVDLNEFNKQKAELDAKPDGKFILHCQREGEEQNGSKYLWFLWRAQQYADRPLSQSDTINFVKEAGERQKTAATLDLPTNAEMGL